MFIRGTVAEKNTILNTAERMCAAARTAPKARGIDKIVTGVITGDEKDNLSAQMRKLAEETGAAYFERDANNVDNSTAVVVIGTTGGAKGLNCGYCGFPSCSELAKTQAHCAYDDIDLGVAVGSAISVAADNRIDNRVMLSAGIAALRLGYLGKETLKVLAIPLSTSGKSLYYDR
ncbi:MAG: ferredoxin domain-containing protein [Anaerotignaceae bacterium]